MLPFYIMSVVKKEKKIEFLNTIFFDVDKSPVALKGASTVFKYLRDVLQVKNVSYPDVVHFERKYVRSNQIIRPRRLNHPRLQYKSYGLNHQWQLDLVDLHAVGRQKGNRFLLTKIDVFSRQADAELLSSKSSLHVLNGFKKFVERNAKPHGIQTDEGKEFVNKYFKQYCDENKINFFQVNSEMKASMVERFNRTFQNNYYKILKTYPNRLKKDVVSLVIKNYNLTPHSVTGFIPSQINEENSGDILNQQMDERERESEVKRTLIKSYRFGVGDKVRLSHDRMVFSKEYRGTFSEEVFEIVKRFRRQPNWNINLYKVKDLLGEDIDGIFYEEQLLKVHLPLNPREGRIVRRDKRRGKLVTLIDYPKGHSIWKK